MTAKTGLFTGFAIAYQLADWHGYDVGSAPGCRNALFAERGTKELGDHGADDCCDPAFAIEHRCSRRAVVDDQTVIPLIHFKKTGARELALGCVLHKSTTDRASLAFGVGHRHDTIIGHERRYPD